MTVMASFATDRARAVRHIPPVHRIRLRLKPKASSAGHVDGAWWPREADLTAEVADLLAVLSVRLGPIHRVSYHLGEWAEVPRKTLVDGQLVPLDGFRFQPAHTLAISGTYCGRIVLLVVPPHTPPEYAHAAMMLAARPENTATAESLLCAWPAGASPAEQRWDSEGGASGI
jgi:hypothetical protein